MKSLLLIVILVIHSGVLAADPVISKEKRAEIEMLLEKTGTKKMVDVMLDQMQASMKTKLPELAEAYWTRLRQRLDAKEILEMMMPIYDKYYTLEDLKGMNEFYDTPLGKKMVAVMPQVAQESMKVGMEWGKTKGKEVFEEAEKEAAKAKEKPDKPK